MIKIAYPSYPYKIEMKDGKEYIFDPLRKKWVRLSPEEWVRQNFLQYLLQVKYYPASLIAVEKEIMVGELKKRFDILVYKNDQPWLLVECKEMNIPIDEIVFQQLLRYQSSLQASYIIITNGNETKVWATNKKEIINLHAIPDYNDNPIVT
ncbi:MAG: type I restriction enzyme HsdR N-terminal domain-containing protein [Chitinophagaceae bacterium]|nr:type I restriction enzyme HsdR N-terminal domain-containing protein [Chitinophagaceae bacterium]